MVDFIDPTIEVHQVLVQNVTEELNFAKVPRIDRCKTCHLGIDNPDYADAHLHLGTELVNRGSIPEGLPHLHRALALDPPYVLMDEPFGALDPISRDQIHEEFLQLKAHVRKTIILVTHDMAEAFKLADRIALMNCGQIIQVGREEDFRTNPATPFVSDFLGNHLHEGAPHA